MPCCRIESISSCNASRAKFLRGCSALGMMVAKLIWCTLSPDSPVSARVAADGVPINAPSPLPRPDRAMRLRLREQFHQRKQQSAIPCRCLPSRQDARWPHSQDGCATPLLQKKFKKNVLTPKTEIWYHAPLAPKQTKDFYPVGSLSVRTLIITQTNETPGEKEHNNPCIHSINSKHQFHADEIRLARCRSGAGSFSSR